MNEKKYIHCNNNNLRFWITHSARVFRNLIVLASFISMDLMYENLTFRGILFLMFSILNLSHPVTNALEILSFLEVLKLHFITFFLLSYINQGRLFSQLSCLENARNTDLSLWFGADQGLNLQWTTLKAIMLTITQLVWFRCLLYLFF